MSSRLMRATLDYEGESGSLNNTALHSVYMPKFDIENHKIITEFIEKYEKEKSLRKIAVFDADGTLWRGDVGESFFQYQLKKSWIVPEKIGFQKETDLWKLYYDEVLNGDKAKAYGWIAQWNAGIHESEMQRWCAEYMASQNDIIAFESMRTLTHSLMNAGFEVWVVSASPVWAVLESSRGFGIQPDHVIGVSVEVENGILTNKVVQPLPYRAGKVEAIKNKIAGTPLLVAGNTWWDRDMLDLSRGIALTIESEKINEPNFASEQEIKNYALGKKLNSSTTWLCQKF